MAQSYQSLLFLGIPVSRYRSVMDRMFDNAFFGEPSEWRTFSDLALDVAENENEFLVKASLPGINPDDLDITFSGKTLTIKGEYKAEEEKEDVHYHLRERRYGSFSRSLSLPSPIDADAIQAKYEAGVLTLHLPKTEEAKPKRIAVGVSDKPQMIEGKVSDIKGKN
jgi:HSP20 family protein